jgi:hypothetical protein
VQHQSSRILITYHVELPAATELEPNGQAEQDLALLEAEYVPIRHIWQPVTTVLLYNTIPE